MRTATSDVGGDLSEPGRTRGQAWLSVAHATAVFCLMGSAIIHAAVIRDHFEEWWAAGITFIILASLEGAAAVALLARPSRPLYLAGTWLSQVTIGLWVLSRTVGLPFGPDPFTPEPVGGPDVTATVLEAVTWVALTSLFLAKPPPVRWRRALAPVLVVAVAVLAATSYAVAEAGGHRDDEGSHDSLTGPIVPIDGHSLLSRWTPTTEVRAGRSVGLVVGELRNASDADVVVRSARLIGPSAPGLATGLFWIVSPASASPGEAISTARLKEIGIPLPGYLPVEPFARTGSMPLLVLEVRSRSEGEYIVSALRITYQADGETFHAPYATNATLVVR
jgi:hypothetical protein